MDDPHAGSPPPAGSTPPGGVRQGEAWSSPPPGVSGHETEVIRTGTPGDQPQWGHSAPPGPEGQQYGDQPHGGQPYGGQPYGGQPYGGQPYGGQPYGGQPGPGGHPQWGAAPPGPAGPPPAPPPWGAQTAAQPWAGAPHDAGQPWYPPPAEPPAPRPVGPPRSRWAAGLLNLTGLGLGYAYLGHVVRCVIAALITIVALVVAFVTHAANTPWPWRIGLLAWLVITALDGIRLARRTPRPTTQTRPVLVGVGAVAVIVAACALYGVGQHSAYTDGTAAMARGDCGAAGPSFDSVTGPYRLTLSSEVPAASTRRAECDAFTAAGAGDNATVISAFEAFRRDHADSPLMPFANARLGDAYLDKVAQLQKTLADQNGDARATSTRTAFETLLTIKRELPGTDAAGKVPSTMTGLFATAEAPFAKKQYCDALPVLDYAVTLPAAETGSVVGTANVHRAQALLGCGLSEFNAGHYAGATTVFKKLISAYPQDGGVPQAKAAIIAADVASKTSDPIPLPAPLDRPGSLRVLFYNLLPTPQRIEVAGASAADITLPPCVGCPSSYPPSQFCPSPSEGKPQLAVQLDPGLYHLLITGADGVPAPGDPFTAADDIHICILTTQGGGVPGGT